MLSTKAAERTKAKEPLAVTTLTIPMHSLIDPVIVPGFGFAVINDEGRGAVPFGSASQPVRGLFVESDGSRRLKALVSSRHEEWVDIKYRGDDHRAFVTPMELSVGVEPARSRAVRTAMDAGHVLRQGPHAHGECRMARDHRGAPGHLRQRVRSGLPRRPAPAAEIPCAVALARSNPVAPGDPRRGPTAAHSDGDVWPIDRPPAARRPDRRGRLAAVY